MSRKPCLQADEVRRPVGTEREAVVPNNGFGSYEMVTQMRTTMKFHPGDYIGRYEIRKVLGIGADAIVYLAKDSELHRYVSVMVADKIGSDIESLMYNHARILSELQHPLLLSIFDIGRHDGQLYVVMEFIEGGTLRAMIRDIDTRSNRKQLIEIIVNITDALDFVHRRGFFHREMKPGNILIDGSGQPRLTGFELAVQNKELGLMRERGAPEYMAPEQFDDTLDEIGPYTDIWGLGVILFEVLTRQLPFNAKSVPLISNLIATTNPR